MTHYCPGCGHGPLHKLIAEAIDDLGIQNQTILVSPVGCSVFAYHYFDVGNVQAAHGRACAVATGIKRSQPGSVVISYQGDGDLASIGIAETLHAANRGENITVFFVNNAIYGMTGGQMAPTTLIGQKTVTSPLGRNPLSEGNPLRICELLSSLAGVSYLERVALAGPRHHMKARQAVRRALRCQMEGRGFSLVEVLSACPTGWKKAPADAWRWIEEQMLPVFPLGVFKEPPTTEAAARAWPVPVNAEQVVPLLDLPLERTDGRPQNRLALNECYSGIKIAGFRGPGSSFARNHSRHRGNEGKRIPHQLASVLWSRDAWRHRSLSRHSVGSGDWSTARGCSRHSHCHERPLSPPHFNLTSAHAG